MSQLKETIQEVWGKCAIGPDSPQSLCQSCFIRLIQGKYVNSVAWTHHANYDCNVCTHYDDIAKNNLKQNRIKKNVSCNKSFQINFDDVEKVDVAVDTYDLSGGKTRVCKK